MTKRQAALIMLRLREIGWPVSRVVNIDGTWFAVGANDFRMAVR